MPIAASRPSALRTAWLAALLAVLAAIGAPAASAQAPNLPPPLSASGIAVSVETFGVGGYSRPGEWTGVRVVLQDASDRPRQVVVRLTVPDADGDEQRYERAIALNPGRPQGVWLYPRTSYRLSASSVFTVTVHAAEEGDSGDFAAGEQLAFARITPQRVLESGVGMEGAALIGLVGRAKMGLELYAERPPGSRSLPGTAHEFVELVSDLKPATLPDLWLGLQQFESLVWVEGEPSERDQLTDDAADAIREWIHRGGHLVVVLPPVGQTWFNARSNKLFDLMPRVTVERREQVDLEPYRDMLTDSRTLALPQRAVLHVLIPQPGADPSEAAPILAGPDRAPVVVRRIVGAGMVTVIGFDLANTSLAGRIDPQTLWHRILGKRFDVLSTAEMVQREASREVEFSHRGGSLWIDDGIGAQINMRGESGQGVLLAIIVFAAYLLLAGPLGFAALKSRGLQRHAWVAFVGAAGVFTLVAWGGATLLRTERTSVRHFTVLDHVYGQSVQSARTWFSAFLPEYGEAEIRVGDPAAPGPWRNAVAAWDNPADVGASRFPDTRAYVINTRNPHTLNAPARSTVKQLTAEWLGPPTWLMPRPADGGIVLDSSGVLRGAVVHELPADLVNVDIVLVQRQRPYAVRTVGGPLFSTIIASRLNSWPAGEPFDLATLATGSRAGLGDRWFADLARGSRSALDQVGAASPQLDSRSALENLRLLTWHTMLEPPTWHSRLGAGVRTVLQRRAVHRLDLGKWTTQPCLIIVGELEEAPTPVPLFIDGRPAPSEGRTIVRWIYPLRPSPAAPDPADRG